MQRDFNIFPCSMRKQFNEFKSSEALCFIKIILAPRGRLMEEEGISGKRDS